MELTETNQEILKAYRAVNGYTVDAVKKAIKELSEHGMDGAIGHALDKRREELEEILFIIEGDY